MYVEVTGTIICHVMCNDCRFVPEYCVNNGGENVNIAFSQSLHDFNFTFKFYTLTVTQLQVCVGLVLR